MLKFHGKRHARAANNRLRLDGRHADARRHLSETVRAERAYERIVTETTKHTIKSDKAAEIAESLAHRKRVTRRLVEAMEKTGRKIMFADDMGTAVKEHRPFRPRVTIRMPGDKPGEELVYTTENTRRVNFFPEIAAQKHAAMVKDLRAFVQRQRPGSICMMTFNAGTRWRAGSRVDNLKEGRGELRGALRKLFRLPSFLDWFEPVLIGEEFGTPKSCCMQADDAQEWRLRTQAEEVRAWHLHTHAHTLLRFKRHIPDFNRLMQWVRLQYYEYLHGVEFPGLCRLPDFDKELTAEFKEKVAGWLAGAGAIPLVEYDGALKHADEACKYPFKDKDIETLLDAGDAPEVLCALFDSLFRARLCTPLNSFREFRKNHYQRNGLRHKFVVEKSPDKSLGESVGNRSEIAPRLVPVNDWNCQTPNMAEAISERKKRAKERKEINRLKSLETLEYKRILKSRLGEWGDFEKSPDYRIKPFPRNDFQLDGYRYNHWPEITCLQREITWLFERLITSSILFEVAIPPFVLEQFRLFPGRVDAKKAILEIATEKRPERKKITNLVTARIAPSFLGGGTIARPGIVVIGATPDGRIWQNNPLARRLEAQARPLITEAVEQRDYEAAFPDYAPPDACACPLTRARAPGGAHAGVFKGGSQTPLNFQFSAGPPSAAPPKPGWKRPENAAATLALT
jgi:hypothetical protein